VHSHPKNDERPSGFQDDTCSLPDTFFREVRVEFLIHELKDPLSVIETGIRTLLERQEKYGALSPRQVRTLERTLRNSRKARSMVYDLLEVGRAQAHCIDRCRFDPDQVTYTALREVVETQSGEMAEQMERTEGKTATIKYLEACGILLEVAPHAAGWQVVQDETKFRVIVGNLIKNAIRYRRQEMRVRLDHDGEMLVLDVSDDGPGIDPRHHELVFERYVSTAGDNASDPRRGHGLGLACSRILARSMGGDIVLTSKRRQGARFRLTLPLGTTCSQVEPSEST